MLTKVCTKCGAEKACDQFYRRKKTGRLDSWCRACSIAYVSKRQREHPEKHKANHRNSSWKRQGINLTHDAYVAMLESQHGVCAICKSPCATGKSLAVDHDHVTGKVRALLCSGCNQGIGSFKDSPPLLIAAAEYCIEHGR